MRIADNQLYKNLLNDVKQQTNDYRYLQMKSSASENILQPSDDPTGTASSLNYRAQYDQVEQFIANLKNAQSLLESSEVCTDELSTILDKVKTLAQTNATETSTASDRATAAAQVSEYIDQIIEIMNTQVNGRYIFSGYSTDTPPYSRVGLILDPQASTDNTYSGTLSADGDYTGEENCTYLVQVEEAGSLGEATAKISTDGGTTWSDPVAVTADMDLGNGVNLHFNNDGEFAAGDQFKVQIASGKFQGDDGQIQLRISNNSTVTTNITAAQTSEQHGLLQNLYNLQAALQNDNTDEISTCLENFTTMQEDFSSSLVQTGVYLNRVDVALNQLEAVDANLLSAIQDIEKIDLTSAVSELTNRKEALTASTALLADVLPTSLLDYLS